MLDGNWDETIHTILARTQRIALVGASSRPWRRSFVVTRFLLDLGYDVVPVNPQTRSGIQMVRALSSIAHSTIGPTCWLARKMLIMSVHQKRP
jgi:uncharacterized protein